MALRYRSIGLMYTRACPLSCAHCITESAPHVKERMTLAQAKRYVEVIARFAPELSLTGGEPLLAYRELADLIRFARRLGLRVGAITGAGWAKSEREAARRVGLLADAGLATLEISWDRYHEEQVSLDHAVRVAKAATDRDLRVAVRVTSPPGAPDPRYESAFAGLPVTVTHGSLIRLGRARGLPASHFSTSDVVEPGGCPVLLHPVIEPDGGVLACCGPARYADPDSPLRVGNAEVEPLDTILERASADHFLLATHALGPGGVRSLLGAGERPASREYTDVCELCLDLASTRHQGVVRRRMSDFDARLMVDVVGAATGTR